MSFYLLQGFKGEPGLMGAVGPPVSIILPVNKMHSFRVRHSESLYNAESLTGHDAGDTLMGCQSQEVWVNSIVFL